MNRIHVSVPSKLWTNQVETNRLKTYFMIIAFKIGIPDSLIRKLIWPSHVPLPSLENPSLENPTVDEPDACEAVSSLVKLPLPLLGRFPEYMYDPRHMLCLSCLEDVLRCKFWSWWEVRRRLPPVNAPNQPDCWRGLDCNAQELTDHAAMYNVSGLFVKSRLPVLSY